jgi:hypothetical protein
MISVAYATIITLPLWVASPEDWYRLSCTRLAHDPLPHDPAATIRKVVRLWRCSQHHINHTP